MHKFDFDSTTRVENETILRRLFLRKMSEIRNDNLLYKRTRTEIEKLSLIYYGKGKNPLSLSERYLLKSVNRCYS